MPQEEEKKVDDKKVEETKALEVSKDTITVDLDGISIDVPLETGKKLIAARQAAKKEVKDLSDKVAKAEASAKAEADRASLLKSMKELDIESVKTQVAQEFTQKIAQYENKIFVGEIKSQLATLGVLPDALQDAATLALQGAKVTLDGEMVKVNDKDSKEYLAEWIKTKSHLLAVKVTDNKNKTLVRGGKVPEQKPTGTANLKQGLGKLFK